MRDIVKVIDRVLELIPETETKLRVGLHKVKRSAIFAAPEIMSSFWMEASKELSHAIPKPTEPWQLEILSIWNGIQE